MKYTLLATLLLSGVITIAQTSTKTVTLLSPLAIYSSEWNKPVYAKCNTAAKAIYMTKTEREVIYILNLVRNYPVQFANTVLKTYPDKTNRGWISNTSYYESLMDTLLKMEPVNLLMPDKKCYTSAECHATTSGKLGYVGHERQSSYCTQKQDYNAECCDYGNDNALDIVLSLLIDEDVPSLGHRWACIGPYIKIGVSIKPHIGYRYNSVLDFSF
ncbi:hypothetical protein LK994_06310 [Ferruginibacter lapsinanis]|uniref:hypothetical protein n=1 Tax=Ferruginibacter lapsinanis TaxID=563172 RepID=UPI001E5C2BFD|nr:hypothetical protein [Ferruginibacter lapsinanis]UEG51087.1 hypothetical protein LK994_06310 [Ferruginibacter lapsinanis]